MRLAELRPTSRVVLQSFLRDSVQLCACELVDATANTLELRPLDELPAGIAGQPVTLLTSGQDCLVRVAGQVQSVDDGRVQVMVDGDEVEEVQRRRFERLTGWLAVKLTQDPLAGAGTLVDASEGGAAVLTNLDIATGTVTMSVDGHAAQAKVVGLTRLDSGIRRLHLEYLDDDGSTAAGRAVMGMLGD